jgi:hypothetical protein
MRSCTVPTNPPPNSPPPGWEPTPPIPPIPTPEHPYANLPNPPSPVIDHLPKPGEFWKVTKVNPETKESRVEVFRVVRKAGDGYWIESPLGTLPRWVRSFMITDMEFEAPKTPNWVTPPANLYPMPPEERRRKAYHKKYAKKRQPKDNPSPAEDV